MIFSNHIRWQIIEKYLEGLSTRKIAKHLGVSRSSISRVLVHFQRYGCIEKLPSLSGKPRSLNMNDINYLQVLMKEKPDWYLYELQSEMELWLGRNISLTTIWRTIH